MINRTFVFKDKNTVLKLFKSLLRLKLEYCVRSRVIVVTFTMYVVFLTITLKLITFIQCNIVIITGCRMLMFFTWLWIVTFCVYTVEMWWRPYRNSMARRSIVSALRNCFSKFVDRYQFWVFLCKKSSNFLAWLNRFCVSIGAVVIVWRVRGKTIRSVLCNVVCNSCAQCDAHTYEQTNRSLDWVLSHWAHFTVLRFIFACIMCIIVYCMHV